LNVLDNPIKHYFDGFGWEIADYMFEQVLKQIKTIIIGANFFSLNANEVATIDDQFWILVHAYVTHAWKRILISLTFQHVVEGGNANNLIVVIAQAFM